MINVYPVWEQGIFGSGIRVRVNDQGIDTSHNEFTGRFDKDASCDLFEAPFDKDKQEFYQHGTMVASIIGAAGNNSGCSVGIAPNVTFSSCLASTTPELDQSVANGNWLAVKLDQMDISQNSYGSVPCIATGTFSISENYNIDTCPFRDRPDEYIYRGEEMTFEHPCDECKFPLDVASFTEKCARAIYFHCALFFEWDKDTCIDHLDGLVRSRQCSFFYEQEAVVESMERGAKQGRNGKGVIYVFASGNHLAFGADTNFAGRWQSRFIVYVGAVGKDGLHTQYSTPGASLMVVAPVGDRDDPLTIGTARAGGGCQKTGSGTSFASPIVSGVIALMLEANPDLTWRDVQGILASTSKAVTHTTMYYQDETQVTNAAGLTHSNLYGFGIVDAYAAVTAAQQWELYSDEMLLMEASPTLNLTIGDDPNHPTMVELFMIDAGLIVETVQVVLHLEHLSRGHLKIQLTSPRGTTSELTPGFRPENGQGSKPWILQTVKSWGEVAKGSWSLSIADMVPGDVSSCIDLSDWQVQGMDYLYDCALVEWFPDLHDAETRGWIKNLFVAKNITDSCCSCGGGTRSEDNGCVDHDETCAEAESQRVCRNGTLTNDYAFYDLKDDRGRSLWDSCCIAGGGVVVENPDDFRDKLVRWELKVYGHAKEEEEEEHVSSPPSEYPTRTPTKKDTVSMVPSNKAVQDQPSVALGSTSPPLIFDDPPISVESGAADEQGIMFLFWMNAIMMMLVIALNIIIS